MLVKAAALEEAEELLIGMSNGEVILTATAAADVLSSLEPLLAYNDPAAKQLLKVTRPPASACMNCSELITDLVGRASPRGERVRV